MVAGGAGAAAIAARRSGVLDDGLRTLGFRPHTEPDPRDIALLQDAADDQRELLALVDQAAQATGDSELADVRRVLAEQLAAVSGDGEGTPRPTGTPSPLPADAGDARADFAERVKTVADARADGAVSAGSLAVTQVLAAMSAGLDQVAVAVKEAT